VSPTLVKNRTAVVGIGQTTLGKGLPDTELSLACQAVSLALDDAGVAPSEVDGLASFTMEPNREVDVARAVGLGDITFFSQVGFGGGAGCGVVGHAAMAIATGQANVVVAWRARKRASAASRPWAQVQARLWVRGSGGLRAAVAWAGRLAEDGEQHDAVFVEASDRGRPGIVVAHRYVDRPGAAHALGEPLIVDQPGPLL